jgi:hypothetical protein
MGLYLFAGSDSLGEIVDLYIFAGCDFSAIV